MKSASVVRMGGWGTLAVWAALGIVLTGGCDTTPPPNDPTDMNTGEPMDTNGPIDTNGPDDADDPLDTNGPADPNGPTEVAGEPLVSFETDFFAGSSNCAVCHTGLVDASENDVSIDTHWRATMMANAARDPFWQAMVSSEVERFPEIAAVIEDTCANCHMPMAHVEMSADGESVPVLGDGLLDPEHPLHKAAMDGVSCTLCHQIQDLNLGETESFSGGYSVDELTVKPARHLYGPYEDVDTGTMQVASGYLPIQGLQLKESALCATCHTLYTPYLNAEGEIAGSFPEQTAFLEWRHSDAGDGLGEDQSCQDCHMSPANGPVTIATVPSGLPAREPFARHFFVGGNVFMLTLMRDNIEELGLTASSSDYNATIDRAEDMLTTRTADVTIAAAEIGGETLSFDVEIASRAGHKVPTGFPSRKAWLYVTVEDGSGAVVFESGRWDGDGRIEGDDALAEGGYEMHHDTITSADQVQIYESVMENTKGEVTYTLLRGAAYIKDNRLLPPGFEKATADADFAVYGAAATDDDFVGGSDRVSYAIAVTPADGPFEVTARLLFQSVSYPFVSDMREDDTELVSRFGNMYDASDRTPTTIDTATETVGG